MSTEIKMPQLSDTMNAGKILSWRKKEGDTVKRGDILAEVETEKANLEIESFHEGVLLKIVTAAGESARVGQAIAYVGKAGEQIVQSGTAEVMQSQPPAPASIADNQAAAPSPRHSPAQPERIKASPLARRIAEEKHIDLSLVHGSGPQGRVIKKDLESIRTADLATERAGIRTRTAVVGNTESALPAEGGELQGLSRMRQIIAQRMQQSMSESPHFYSTVSVNMREVLRFKSALKEEALGTEISINHLIIKAAAFALQREPRVNCAMRDEQLFQPQQINIGVITAVDDGLLIPVIHNADRLSMSDIAFETRAAIERVRAGRPSSSDLTGGTFSISNMGMFDIENFTAIISPGQGAVLAVSSTIDTPIAENGHVVIAPMMKVTLGVDHRIIDGVMAANFLKHFKRALETPALLMV